MYITIDIGGTNTRMAKIKNGKISEIDKFKTKVDDFFTEIKLITNFIKGETKVEGIGISAPGPANYKTGLFGNLPNMPSWEEQNIIEALSSSTGIKNIKMENDANLMALAHHCHFNNQEGITQFFTISTGLGAGLIINNEIFSGYSGNAQEIAQAPLAWEQTSGKGLSEGSIELFSSGSGIEYLTKMNAKEALCSKDPIIKNIIKKSIESLGNLIATSIAFINPNMMVFDGSVARYNKEYILKSIELAKSRTNTKQFNIVQFKFAELGDNAALIGAYKLIK